jgi:hypothetical protein
MSELCSFKTSCACFKKEFALQKPKMFVNIQLFTLFQWLSKVVAHVATKSPIYSQFGETISGTSTIRAYNQQERFIAESADCIDDHKRSQYNRQYDDQWNKVKWTDNDVQNSTQKTYDRSTRTPLKKQGLPLLIL